MKPVIHTENESDAVSRITQLLIEHGKTQGELLEYLGLHRNNFTEWKAGRKKSYLYYIDDIARYFDVSPTYLLRGEEETPLSKDEQDLISVYRHLPSEAKEYIISTVKALECTGSNALKTEIMCEFDRKGDC